MPNGYRTTPEITAMLNFLNPPKGSMDGPSYQALKRQRLEMWNNFVKNHGKI